MFLDITGFLLLVSQVDINICPFKISVLDDKFYGLTQG